MVSRGGQKRRSGLRSKVKSGVNVPERWMSGGRSGEGPRRGGPEEGKQKKKERSSEEELGEEVGRGLGGEALI